MHMHTQGVAHRDIKIENLMFLTKASKKVKIGDFGLAKQISTRVTGTPCGTKEYMAPEMFAQTPQYTLSVDVWALGCLMYIVLFGRFPFYTDEDVGANNVMNIKDKIRRGKYSFPTGREPNAGVSEAARDLIRGCLQVDPQRRLTIEQVVMHPWIRQRQDNTLPLSSPAIMRDNRDLVSLRDINNVSNEFGREQHSFVPVSIPKVPFLFVRAIVSQNIILVFDDVASSLEAPLTLASSLRSRLGPCRWARSRRRRRRRPTGRPPAELLLRPRRRPRRPREQSALERCASSQASRQRRSLGSAFRPPSPRSSRIPSFRSSSDEERKNV